MASSTWKLSSARAPKELPREPDHETAALELCRASWASHRVLASFVEIHSRRHGNAQSAAMPPLTARILPTVECVVLETQRASKEARRGFLGVERE
jgi:hypothetical protein